ncbi:two-component sensor histidine kinase [Malaciobacter halophilus]|uniref:histidine kinase n=1 Tax=Malaciobacter halophilus TaxID=197482 RepID=A0A2N1J1K2_9BACT|nr:ATP-binding protein [Malaciobacter halophilus]AXH08594.1 two-component system sensor histidine kinase [Malaciobacter halophilus]PKI80440.1 two-component sensor histidine kinase [Malaciobacter halophilus]
MLKIHQLFLRTFIGIFFLIFLSISFTTYFWSKNIYMNQIEKNLSQNIDSISLVLHNINDIEKVVNEFKKRTNLRITIIDEKGKVIVESDKDKSSMENHQDRFEIIHAKYDGIGKTIRFSDSLNKELLYVAKKIKLKDKTYYIRLADYTDKIQENFLRLSFHIIAIITIFLILAFFATYFISIKIKKETDSILKFLIDLSEKRPNYQISSNYTQEFNKIARFLNKVAAKLAKKEKQKAKQTAKLKLANRQKDEIISAISHEFKNPIAIISGYSETLLCDSDLPNSMKEKFLNKIKSNGDKMSNIIDKLRLSLKLEEGKQQVTTQNCSIKKLCEAVVSDLQDKYKEHDITIEGEDINLKVDETLMEMAISNLVENALKYSEDDVIIKLSSSSISIIDKGIGIEENDLNKINKKFYRVSKNGWNNSLGLGLFIVQAILSLHNFKLEVRSKLHSGSEFIIKY